MRNITLITLLAALLGLFVWNLNSGTTDAEELVPGQGGRDSLVPADSVELVEGQSNTGEVATRTQALPETKLEVADATDGALTDDPKRVFVGRFVVTDAEGRVEEPQDGRVYVSLSDGPFGRGAQCEVEQGRFTFPFPGKTESLTFSQIALGKKPAHCKTVVQFHEWVPGQEYVLYAKRSPKVKLAVVDSVTGTHLPKVEVTRDHSYSGNLSLPSERVQSGSVRFGQSETVLAFDKPSPVTLREIYLQAHNDSLRLRIYHPGYAYQSITINPRKPGIREVRMQRAGQIHWRVSGTMAKGLALRAYQAIEEEESAPVGYWPVTEKKTEGTISGVPPGSYVLRVEQGGWYTSPLIFGTTSVEVVEDAPSQAHLELAPPEEANQTLAPFAGYVHIPEAWSIGRTKIDFVLHLPNGRPGSSATYLPLKRQLGTWDYAFDAGNVPIGTYHVSHGDTGSAWVIELGPAGNKEARFIAPAPGEVRVRIVHGVTGDDAMVDTVYWSVRGEGASTVRSPISNADYDSELGAYKFLAPIGRIEVSAFSMFKGLKGDPIQIHVKPGVNEAVMRVVEPTILQLDCTSGGKLVALGKISSIQIDQLHGEEATPYKVTSYSHGPPTVMWFDEPGRYRITLPPIPGYDDVPTFSVDLVQGKTTEHTIELKPEGR